MNLDDILERQKKMLAKWPMDIMALPKLHREWIWLANELKITRRTDMTDECSDTYEILCRNQP